MKKSIRRQLIVAFMGLAIAPLIVLGGIFSWMNYDTVKDEVLKLQSEMAREPRIRLETTLENASSQLRLAADMYFLDSRDQDIARSFLKMLMAKEPYEKILLVDHEGKPRISLSRLELSMDSDADYSGDEAFIATQGENEVYFSSVWFDEVAGEPLITIAIPLENLRTGQHDGALIAEIRLKVVWDMIANVKVLPGQSLYIVDSNDRLVAHANPSLVLRGTTFHVPDSDGVHQGLTGEKTLMAIQAVRYGGRTFSVVSEQKTSDAFDLANQLLLVTGILVVLALLASGSLGVLLVRQIVRPIQSISRTAQNISAGDLSQRVKVWSGNEFGILAGAFNSMTTQLQSLVDGLEGKVKERTAQLEAAQLELLQQERLAALGKVIATIAHEIRNPLGTVNTSIFSLRMAMEKEDTVRINRALVMAERNIKRCDSIITEILDYTRKIEIRPSKVDLDIWLGEILEEQKIPETISCQRRFSCGLEMSFDREHMRRAVVNTLANAVHAMSDNDGHAAGELVVETAVVAGRVEIRVIDTGSGIPKEICGKIFEPLFSTKSFGVGLGLAIIRDILEAHGGGVDIRSEVGKGTCVSLWIPMSPE
jgi:signal transduction histidine kinase